MFNRFSWEVCHVLFFDIKKRHAIPSISGTDVFHSAVPPFLAARYILHTYHIRTAHFLCFYNAKACVLFSQTAPRQVPHSFCKSLSPYDSLSLTFPVCTDPLPSQFLIILYYFEFYWIFPPLSRGKAGSFKLPAPAFSRSYCIDNTAHLLHPASAWKLLRPVYLHIYHIHTQWS